MSEFIKSKKFTGVSHKLLKNKDKSYYISYKMNGKFKRTHIGKKIITLFEMILVGSFCAFFILVFEFKRY